MSAIASTAPTRKRSPLKIQRAVLLALFIRELRTRIEGRWLGAIWLLFEPLAHVLFILTLFGFLRHTASTTVEFPVFLVTGLLPFFIFRNVTLRLADAIGANKGLFSYRQVKPIDTLFARALVETLLYSAVYVITLSGLGWAGFHWLPWAPLELMGVLLMLVLMGMSLGLVLAVVTFDRPKARSIVGLIFLPLYISSGVIFAVHNLPGEIRQYLLWNPVLHLIESSRGFFIESYRPMPGVNLFFPLKVILILSALGLSLYRVNRQQLIAQG
ncbi:ABC transporter permease [Caldimonas sp. KR1-144]|uniref:ABC transporter permease n=1 Tax=Caldimonas sp. KR1-144 TaxID=3400911 RepID=UPI003C080736